MRRILLKVMLCFLALRVLIFANSEINKISSEISTVKESFIVGEPITIKTEFCNRGDSEVEFITPLIVFYISEDSVNFRRYTPSLIMEEITARKILLKPGEKWILHSFIFYDAEVDNLVFSKSGVYYLKGRASHNMETNVIQIKINEPGELDLAVWGFLKNASSEYAEFLQLGYVLEKAKESEVIKTLKQIIEKYPASTYTPYIKEALIKYYRTKPDKTPEEKEYLKTLQKD